MKTKIEVYAHRGSRSYLPENSLPGYKLALEQGADWVDMDVVMTKDGEILVTHDPILNPDIVRDSEGRFLGKNSEMVLALKPEEQGLYIQKYSVRALTLSQLRLFDVGRLNPESAYAKFFPKQLGMDDVRMPTLTEVIRFVKREVALKAVNASGFTRSHPVKLQIELKTAPTHPSLKVDPEEFARALFKVLGDEDCLDQSEIQAFDFDYLLALQKLSPKFKTAYLTSRETSPPEHYGGSFPRMIHALGGFAWEPEDFQLTPAALAEARSLGLKVVVWSWPEKTGVDFDEKLTRKMIEMGVDGIITDDPPRLLKML